MIDTVIFDLDGVISDTQKLHSAAESEVLGSAGVIITPKAAFKNTLLDVINRICVK